MTNTRQAEQVRGALGGIVIALATLIAIFALSTVARAQTPSANILGATGATTVDNGASSVIGASTTVPAADMGSTTGSASTTMGSPAGSTSAESEAGTTTSTGTSGTGASPTGAPVLAAPPPSTPAPMVLSVTRDGNVLIRGVVSNVSAGTITLASWGGSWTIVTDADTEAIPGSVGGMHVGDFVGADGIMGTTAFTVNASVVRDWTTAPSLSEGASANTGSEANTSGASTTTNMSSGSSTGATGGALY